MKEKTLIRILCIVLLLSISACGETEDTASQTESQQVEKEDKDIFETKEAGEEEKKDETEDLQDSKAEELAVVTVYYSEDAMTFVSSDVQVDALTSEAVLEALISKEAVANDVKVQLFEKKNVDGKETIEIDFNSAFAEYVSRMGTTGEYYVIGSVCNTYLDAFDCEQIKITVDGQPLSTGHTEYTGYLTTFS